MFEEHWLLNRVVLLIPLLLSLTVHEWAHAWCAWRLGDDTARLLGRLTLNPLAHMDPIGTFALPLLGVPFGWAKPVPFNPVRFRRSVSQLQGTMLVAAAGPISNLVFATLCCSLIQFVPEGGGVHELLRVLIVLNVILALFNLLPIVPLDGSYVANALMPKSLRPAWEAFAGLGWVPLVVFLLALNFFGTGVWDSLLHAIEGLI